jgi:hypothetical protein
MIGQEYLFLIVMVPFIKEVAKILLPIEHQNYILEEPIIL